MEHMLLMVAGPHPDPRLCATGQFDLNNGSAVVKEETSQRKEGAGIVPT